MNLLELLRKEIVSHNITEPLKIAQYIYVRTGELFEYDPLWLFATKEEKEIIKNKKIDIENVTDFKIVCFTWARMYTRLLHAFGIVARVKNIPETDKKEAHANVEVLINGNTYIADITALNKDLECIKFGMDTHYNCQIYKKVYEEKYHFAEVGNDVYTRNIKMEDILKRIKDELKDKYKDKKLNKDEFVYIVYKLICTIMSFPRKNVGFVSGTKFIRDILKASIGDSYIPYNIHYYDKEKNIYIGVYLIIKNGDKHYFAYQKSNEGTYSMNEITEDELRTIKYMYSSKQANSCLKLAK